MKNKLAIPRTDYIVFELVKINADDYMKGEYKAIQEETIYLAVLPQNFNYRLISRDSLKQTDSSVFVNKFGMAPERCTLSGHFGVRPRFIAGNYTGGWDRLKQFEDEIVRKSKLDELPDADGNRFIYALNYYDFIWQRFGSINIQTFTVTGNSRENTQLPRYSIDFVIIGDLIEAESKDLMLDYLVGLYGADGALSDVFGEINDLLATEALNSALQLVGVGLDALSSVQELVQEAMGFSPDVSSAYKSVTELF